MSPNAMGRTRFKQRREQAGSALLSARQTAAGQSPEAGGRQGASSEKQISHDHAELQQQDNGGDFRSLKHQLQAVNLEDPAAVITVREIKNLMWPGASVEERLQQYFESYGAVKDVLVPRAAAKHVSNSRKNPGRNQGCRVRSSNVGWVVMSSADSVLSILRSGQHSVDGVMVRVEEFRRSNWENSDAGTKPASIEEDGTASSGSGASSGYQEKAHHMRHAWQGQRLQVASMVPEPSAELLACHQLQPCFPMAALGHDGQQPLPAMVATDAWGNVVFGPCAVFNASEQELRSAMPEVYTD